MTNRSNTKAWSGQFEVSSEVKSIVRIYKEVAKPDAKVLKLSEDKSLICVGWKYTLFLLRLHISQGLTKSDFRNLLFKSYTGDTRKKDKRFEEEICGDMFRILDKDGDGYVMLEDLLKYFVPAKQLKRMPSDFIGSVNRRKKVVQESKETPRLKQEGEEEIREVYDLWTAYAHELGSKSGKIDRETVIEILAGRRNAEFNWIDAREAADRIFAELPENADDIANGEVKKFKRHPRVQVDLQVKTVKGSFRKESKHLIHHDHHHHTHNSPSEAKRHTPKDLRNQSIVSANLSGSHGGSVTVPPPTANGGDHGRGDGASGEKTGMREEK